MSLTAGEIERIHASFGHADDLVERRRTIYRSALDLAAGSGRSSGGSDIAVEVLDNPAARAHLGEVLAGLADFDPGRMSSIDELTVTCEAGARLHPQVRVAATPRATSVLGGALDRVGVGLGIPDLGADPHTLLVAGAEPFSGAIRTLDEGVELALDLAPALVRDLLPHVALFAILSIGAVGRLGSASVREYPGLILLPDPQTPLEAAEALVHEGAHQKFFDLAMTSAIFGPEPSGNRFTPPWSEGLVAWPLEQCVAAFHAYCCLAAFFVEVRERDNIVLHRHSLLPVAEERAGIIAEWLVQHGSLLGADGQRMVGQLGGRQFTVPAASWQMPDELARMRASGRLAERRCGEWTLLMQLSRPAVLVWLPADNEQGPGVEAADTVSNRWHAGAVGGTDDSAGVADTIGSDAALGCPRR